MVYLGVFSGDYVGLWLVILVVNLLPRSRERRKRFMGVQIWVVGLRLSMLVSSSVMVRWTVFLASWSPPSLLMGYDDMDTSGSNLRPWLFTGRLWHLVRISGEVSGVAAYFWSHHRWVYKFQCIIFSILPAMGLFFHVCQSFLRVPLVSGMPGMISCA